MEHDGNSRKPLGKFDHFEGYCISGVSHFCTSSGCAETAFRIQMRMKNARSVPDFNGEATMVSSMFFPWKIWHIRDFWKVNQRGSSFLWVQLPFFWAHTPYENHGTWEMKLPSLLRWCILSVRFVAKSDPLLIWGWVKPTIYTYIYIYPLVIFHSHGSHGP